MSHSCIDHRFKSSTEGRLIDSGAKALNDTRTGQSADAVRHGIGGEVDTIAKRLPSDSAVRLKNTENFAVNMINYHFFNGHLAILANISAVSAVISMPQSMS